MSAHLGTRVSALLDGQLSPVETERAWSHVHECHTCRDLVEREGWVKTRLAGLSQGPGAPAPDTLKGALSGLTPGAAFLAAGSPEPRHRPVRVAGLAAIGGGAVGAAVLGVLALGAAPADTPSITRTSIPGPVSTTTPTTTPSTPGSLVSSVPKPVPVGTRTRR